MTDDFVTVDLDSKSLSYDWSRLWERMDEIVWDAHMEVRSCVVCRVACGVWRVSWRGMRRGANRAALCGGLHMEVRLCDGALGRVRAQTAPRCAPGSCHQGGWRGSGTTRARLTAETRTRRDPNDRTERRALSPCVATAATSRAARSLPPPPRARARAPRARWGRRPADGRVRQRAVGLHAGAGRDGRRGRHVRQRARAVRRQDARALRAVRLGRRVRARGPLRLRARQAVAVPRRLRGWFVARRALSSPHHCE